MGQRLQIQRGSKIFASHLSRMVVDGVCWLFSSHQSRIEVQEHSLLITQRIVIVRLWVVQYVMYTGPFSPTCFLDMVMAAVILPRGVMYAWPSPSLSLACFPNMSWLMLFLHVMAAVVLLMCHGSRCTVCQSFPSIGTCHDCCYTPTCHGCCYARKKGKSV